MVTLFFGGPSLHALSQPQLTLSLGSPSFLRSLRVVWWWCIQFARWLVVQLRFFWILVVLLHVRGLGLFITSSVFALFSSVWVGDLRLPFILVSDLDRWCVSVANACCVLCRKLMVHESIRNGSVYLASCIVKARTQSFPSCVVKARTPSFFFSFYFVLCVFADSLDSVRGV
jgi:hypothetical protein